MKHVSLSKIGPSVATKVSGLFVLAILAVAFLLFPLGTLAMGCNQPPTQATLRSTESLFGPNCGGSTATTNATITTGAQTASSTTTADTAVAPGLLSAVAKCKFVAVKNGQKVVLHNGDIFLAQALDGTPLVGMIVGSKAKLLVGDDQGHAATLNAKTNVGFINGAVELASGKIDTTPNDGAKDAKTVSTAN